VGKEKGEGGKVKEKNRGKVLVYMEKGFVCYGNQSF